VEDAFDYEEAISQVTIEDPIFLITIEDNPMHSMTDDKEEVITTEDNPLHSTTEVNEEVPRSIEDPSINASSSSMATTMEENDLACPPRRPPSPSATPARR
jgi:deoxyxylulose-5-phosphate synthase